MIQLYLYDVTGLVIILFEPVREKTNNLGSDQVQHKPGSTATEAGLRSLSPRGRVVKVADFSALNHSIISPLWVRASLGARVTCGTSQVLLAGVSGVFSPGSPVFAPPTD